MKRINAIDTLNENIRLMEIEQAAAHAALKQKLDETADSLKPGAIIRNMLKPDETDPDAKIGVVDAAIGIASGFLVKKVLLGSIHNPLVSLAGTILQAGVATLVAKHPDPIKNAGIKLFKSLFSRKKNGEGGQREPFDNVEK